jgi:hypothetical protein
LSPRNSNLFLCSRFASRRGGVAGARLCGPRSRTLLLPATGCLGWSGLQKLRMNSHVTNSTRSRRARGCGLWGTRARPLVPCISTGHANLRPCRLSFSASVCPVGSCGPTCARGRVRATDRTSTSSSTRPGRSDPSFFHPPSDPSAAVSVRARVQLTGPLPWFRPDLSARRSKRYIGTARAACPPYICVPASLHRARDPAR